ncbi:hypothetical protein M1446_00505 [Candidatus Dependentiae bacterium]|nr:hypothetical protein [Candidatus Dependentiae bacterium]
MLNLGNAEWLATLISLVFVYFISVTINGNIQTWLAMKMGDDTAYDAGFLTINPFVHFHPLGFILLILSRYGWGRLIPLNPLNLTGRFRFLKSIFMFAIEPIVCVFLAMTALIVLVSFFGTSSFYIITQMFRSEAVPIYAFTIMFPQYSSFAIGMALILVSFVFFNIFLGTLSLIINGFRFALMIGIEKGYSYMAYIDYLVLIVPIAFTFLFSDIIRLLLLKITFMSAQSFANLFGLV